MKSVSGNYDNGNLPIQNRDGEMISGKINIVPNELIRVIFSQLDSTDSTAALLVSKMWNVEVVNVVKEEKQLAYQFVNALISNLKFIAKNPDDYDTMGLDKYEILNVKSYNKYQEVEDKFARDQNCIDQAIIDLTELINETKELEPLNLIKFKQVVINILEKILDSLSSFDDDLFIKALAMTKNVALPNLWKLHYLSDSANVRSKNFYTVFGNLFEARKKIATAMTYPDYFKMESIVEVINTLIQRGHLDRAVEYAVQIPDLDQQSVVLQKICNELIFDKYFDKAIDVANFITDPDIQAEALEHINTAMNLPNG